MLIEMRRVDIVAPRTHALELLRALHRAGSAELVPFDPRPDEARVFGPCPGCPDLAARQSRVARAAELATRLGRVPAAPGELARLWDLDDRSLCDALEALEPERLRVAAADAARARLDERLARLAAWRELVRAFLSVTDRVPAIPGYAVLALVVPADDRTALEALCPDLDAITGGRWGSIRASLDPARCVVVIELPERHAAAARALLEAHGLHETSVPPDLAGRPLAEVAAGLAREEAETASARAAASAELDAAASAIGGRATALAAVLGDRLAEATAMGSAGSSEHMLELPAWVPAARLSELRRRLAEEVGPDAVVVERPERRMEDVEPPVALRNLPLVRAFEPLVSFVGLPRYGTLDPTPAMAVTFPLFVGFMVGDAGYGLVLLAALAVLRWRWGSTGLVATALPVAVIAGLCTVAFGILFGEWFGETGRTVLGIRPLWLDRAEATLPLLLLSVAAGALQVGLGLALGIVNALLLHERREAVARAALLCCLVAGVVLAAAEAAALGPSVARIASGVAIGTIAVAALVLLVAGGASGAIELIGTFGNVLSYARLMAIGLASVMLAVVANRLGGVAGNLLVGFAIALVFHVLNFGLGFFDASIQALRLHYVEFFGKFVERGGRRFCPFVSALDGGRSPLSGGRSPLNGSPLNGLGR